MFFLYFLYYLFLSHKRQRHEQKHKMKKKSKELEEEEGDIAHLLDTTRDNQRVLGAQLLEFKEPS